MAKIIEPVKVKLTHNQIEEIQACLSKKVRDLKAGKYGKSNKIEGISIPQWVLDVEDTIETLEQAQRSTRK